MAYRTDTTAERARQLLDYNPETGELIWKARTPDMFISVRRSQESMCKTWNKRFSGTAAGWTNPKGYRCVCIDCVIYKAHRICWLIAKGEWPEDQIDHRHGERANNPIEKLREATNAQNHQNQKRRKDNTSGFTGVSWHPQTQKWVAYININGKRLSLGLHQTAKKAASVRLAAKAEHHIFQPTERETGG